MNHAIDAIPTRPGPRANAEPRERLENAVSFAQLRPAAVLLAIMVVLTGLAYPLVMTGISATIFPRQATGSLIERDGIVVGSALVAQDFRAPGYFHPRPSTAGFDAASSGASNLAPTNAALIEAVRDCAEDWRSLNGGQTAPVDAVTTSGSGLDPHISVANAVGQMARVADARGVPVEDVRSLVAAQAEGPWLGFVGAPRVNVLLLNLALDAAAPAAPADAGGVADE
jgi:potassium-transporting ATPase KdpC subunit